MKVSFVSDTHMHPVESWKVPECDLLIHTGDFSYQGKLQELLHFVTEMNKIPAKHKILVPGNHDWGFQTNESGFRDICRQNGITVLIHEYIEIEGFKIFGTPWQPYFCNWAFNVEESSRLKRLYNDIPEGLDILATHCPPKGILDHCNGGNVGSPELMERIRLVLPKTHAFGHIHEGYGTSRYINVDFVNSAICNGMYRAVNSAISITL